MSLKRARLFTDGGARGNPGPAAAGFVIYEIGDTGEIIEKVFEQGVFLGNTTNNQAEYQAIVLGLKKARELNFESVDVKLDSELAVKQINGEYKVKNEGLARHFVEIHNLKQKFHEIKFSHVRREFNKEADAAVNRAIDSALGL